MNAPTTWLTGMVQSMATHLAEVGVEVPKDVRVQTLNREAWLFELVSLMAPHLASLDLKVPEKVRVACSWPTRGALSGKGGSRVIGQCFNPAASKDGTHELFVSPALDEPLRVAGVLAHELLHAVVGTEAGHGPKFARACKLIGLEGKATATVEGEAFKAWVAPLLEKLGTYPHARVDLVQLRAGTKRQSTRMVKCKCEECGYTLRTTRKWLDDRGTPLCPCNSEPMEVAA